MTRRVTIKSIFRASGIGEKFSRANCEDELQADNGLALIIRWQALLCRGFNQRWCTGKMYN